MDRSLGRIPSSEIGIVSRGVVYRAVTLWGTRIAAVSIEEGARVATFQYDPAFARGGVEIAPLRMPLRAEPYRFPGRRRPQSG